MEELRVDAFARPPALMTPRSGPVESAENFDVFYRRTHPAMLRLAAALTSSRPVAEDAVSGAYESVHRRYESLTTPDAYLRRAVVNQTIGVIRRRRTERAKRPLLIDRATAPEHEIVGDVLNRLPARQRAAIVLRFYEQCTEAEIATALGCRPGTVKSLVSRGLAALRAEIEP